MGSPQHYGIELPQRCLTLLEGLWGRASQTYTDHTRHLGPLTSTFLISMSMPIINIPTERIEKYLGLRDAEGYVDDRHLNPDATEEFMNVLRRRSLGQAPFFRQGAWRFYRCEGKPINLARGLPEDIAVELEKKEAGERAAAMPASQWLGVLRNALAHGGIIYLDERGRSSRDTPVRMFGFVNGRFRDGPCPHEKSQTCRAERVASGLNILRIAEDDYRDFLQRWVGWMQNAGLAQAA